MIERDNVRAIAVRRAAEPDLDAVARIRFDGWRSTGLATAVDDDLAALRKRIDRELAGGWSLFVGTVDETLAGMLALKPAELDQLFVAPAFRRRGVGVALLREAQRQLPSGFGLRTDVDNARARRFYEREGLMLERIGSHPTRDTVVAYYRWQP
jgi:ribosomal protein S18 acetylase RimI-like enzyme